MKTAIGYIRVTAIATDLNNAGIAGKKGGKWFASSVSYLINRQAA